MLQARLDPNVEVITTLLNLTANGAGEWNAGMPSQPYRREVMQRFAHLREHPAVQKANQLHAQGFWWDAMIQLVLTCTAFPEAILTTPLPNSRYTDAGDGDAEAGKRAIADFLPLVDDFYERARFDNFCREQQPRYEGIMPEVSASWPDASWRALVGNYYGAGAGDRKPSSAAALRCFRRRRPRNFLLPPSDELDVYPLNCLTNLDSSQELTRARGSYILHGVG